MLQEASIMFASSLNDAAHRHFRESQRGVGDISMAFLTTHLRIERWREALLWTWVVAKTGSSDGVWAEGARRQVAELLQLSDPSEQEGVKVKIRRSGRETLNDVTSNFAKAKWEPPRASSFLFCECGGFSFVFRVAQSSPHKASMDGHLPRLPDDRWVHDDIHECEISVNVCFGGDFLRGSNVDAADMFKRLAFERYECGDCCEFNGSGRPQND
jgi:3-O-alpha-D-mannopyranosyl-alpha-D-mannopyranose xylosylphosphotransferase